MLVRVQARQRGKIGRRALQQKQASAVKLQALVKGRQERKEVKALKEEKTNAVVKLQALTKGRNDRKKVQHLKHVKQEQEAQGHAATTLQKVLRGNKERSKVRAIKEEVRGGMGQWGRQWGGQWAHWAHWAFEPSGVVLMKQRRQIHQYHFGQFVFRVQLVAAAPKQKTGVLPYHQDHVFHIVFVHMVVQGVFVTAGPPSIVVSCQCMVHGQKRKNRGQ